MKFAVVLTMIFGMAVAVPTFARQHDDLSLVKREPDEFSDAVNQILEEAAAAEEFRKKAQDKANGVI